MRQNQRVALYAAILFGLAVTAGTAALAQPAADPNEREVLLIRQDFSDCSNANVNDRDPSLEGGTVWVVRGSDGVTRVKVAITVKPNTTYHFFLKCVRILGDIKTQDEGEGFGSFEFPTSSAGNVFAFDMYPEGAPAGNKYQSMQVKY
jgi:hypothetical protein